MISIIIPVHNAEPYLENCLLSIKEQTFDDWECLLINDGSTDKSSSICDNWSQKDCRFKTFHLTNKGVSAARNVGLNESHGPLICFVDADDWIEKDYLETLTIGANKADWIVSGQIREFENGISTVLMPDASATYALSPDISSVVVALESKTLLFGPHEKLYRADIIKKHNLRFQENCSYGEDLIFNYQYLEHAQTISTLAVSGYHYRIHDGSLSSRFRPDQFIEDYHQWRIVKQFHEKKSLWNEDVEKYLVRRLWGIVYDGIFLYPKLGNPPKNYLKHILSIPEILILRKHRDLFHCSSWIKTSIVFRLVFVFRLYFGAHCREIRDYY